MTAIPPSRYPPKLAVWKAIEIQYKVDKWNPRPYANPWKKTSLELLVFSIIINKLIIASKVRKNKL